VLASRGCPYNCIFCAWPQIMYHGSNYRARDPVDVVDEMEFLVRKKGFKSVYFDDDTFNIGRERILKICNEIKKRKLTVPWAIMARVDIMDKELLDEMKSAGLYAIKYGIESAVQKLVDSANKDLDLKKAEDMIEYTNRIGIKTHLTFMFGLPGESHETIQKTIDFALRMNPESVQFSITTPFPGTNYYKDLNKKGMLVSKKWSDYDGNFKSVIKTKELSAKELENAVRIAYNAWAEHQQKRIKDKKSSLIALKKCLNEHGPKYTAKRIVSKVFKKEYMNEKKQGPREISEKNLLLKNFYDKRLDLIGVVDGRHAFTGPNLVQIDLTNKCNNSCIGCWCNSPLLEEKKISGEEKEETLPYSRVISLIDELKKHGTNEIYLGGGGEPFMHPKIMEIIDYIKTNNLVCHLNTNSTLINEKIAEKLIDLEVDHIAVSLWAGDAETYVKTHPNQTKQVFYQIEKTLKFIKKLKNEKNQEKPLIKIYNVISSLNYKNIEKMVEFAYRIADSIEFSVIDVVEGKTDSLLLNEKQRKELLKKSLELKEKYKNKRDFIIFRFDQFIKRISNPLSVKGLYDKKAVDSIPCYVGWTFSRILANGNVIPCLKAHKKPMGNILNKGFSTIFFSEKYNEFRYKSKNFKKNNSYFNCVNCHKSCDDLGRNNEMNNRINSLNSDEKEMLNYARDLRTIKGTIEFLNKKDIKTTYYEKERKKILDNVLNWSIKKIKEKINQIRGKINKNMTSVQIRWNKSKLQQNIRKIISKQESNLDVLLVMCPPWDTKMPPLGLAYLASALEREGFIPKIFDLNIELYNIVENCDKSLWDMSNYLKWTKFNIHNKLYKENAKLLNQFYTVIERVKPLSICFSINISNYKSSLELIKEIKQKFTKIKIGVGGPNIDEDYFMKGEMKDYVDFAVIGEGEIVLPKVLKQIKHGLPIEKIEGILIPSKFNQRRINVNPIIKDLDSIPFPTYKGFPLKKYTQRILPILSSRGCIRRCAYCSDWKMGREYRIRSAENIFEEIKYHVSYNKIKNFDFKDLLINGDINVLNRLCDLIIDSGLKVTWSGQGIIRKEMTFDLLKKMKKSGFSTITYGIESFSNKTLRRMKKGTTKEIIDNVLHDTYNAGIKIQVNLIIGFPRETKQDFEETLFYLRKNSKIISAVSSLSPLSIYGNSDIELNPDSYGISYPKNINFSKWLNKGYGLFWKDDKGVGFEERMSRLKRIMNFLDELNIPYPAFDFDIINKVTNDIRKNNKMELIMTHIRSKKKPYKGVLRALKRKVGLCIQ